MNKRLTRRARRNPTIAELSYGTPAPDSVTACTRFTRDLAILLLASACTRAEPENPTRFEAEIRAFKAADRANPPPLGGIVFVSSSIKNWTDVAADFPGVPVLNRGFGGSTLADVVYYADRIVLRYHPRLVVLYAGDNDLTFES